MLKMLLQQHRDNSITGSKSNTPSPLCPLPSYLANRKSYMVYDLTKSEIRSVDFGSNIAQNHCIAFRFNLIY